MPKQLRNDAFYLVLTLMRTKAIVNFIHCSYIFLFCCQCFSTLLKNHCRIFFSTHRQLSFNILDMLQILICISLYVNLCFIHKKGKTFHPKPVFTNLGLRKSPMIMNALCYALSLILHYVIIRTRGL